MIRIVPLQKTEIPIKLQDKNLAVLIWLPGFCTYKVSIAIELNLFPHPPAAPGPTNGPVFRDGSRANKGGTSDRTRGLGSVPAGLGYLPLHIGRA